MKTIRVLAALAMATAAPAMAMNSGRDNTSAQTQVNTAKSSVVSTAAQPCLRRVDAFGNIRLVCPTLRQARIAWNGRRRSYEHNFIVSYRDGRGVTMYRQWARPMRPR